MEIVDAARWRLAAPAPVVRASLTSLETWPSIWPDVIDVTRRSPATHGHGGRFHVTCRAPDGRARRSEWTVLTSEADPALEAHATGAPHLVARCEVHDLGDTCELSLQLAAEIGLFSLPGAARRRLRAHLAGAVARLARHLGVAHFELAAPAPSTAWLAAARARVAPPDPPTILRGCAPDLPPPLGRLALQTLQDLLFLHWRVDPAALAPMLPAPLTVDRIDGDAWVSLVVLRTTRVTDAAGRDFLGWPFAQVNARTYVRLGEERGVRFLGVACGSWRMALAARALAHLPYRRARVDLRARAGEHHLDASGPHGRVALRWRVEDGDLDAPDRLADRYLSIAGPPGRLWRGDLIHAPWPLLPARVDIAENHMLAALGLPSTLAPRRPDRVAASPGTVAITPPSRRLAP